VKLSVKWLAGLAVIVLSVVAYVGLSTETHVSAQADGNVYVTNSKSLLTTEASPPSDRKYSAKVYSTYAETATRNIEDEYDWMIVTVVDTDLNTTTTVSDDGDQVMPETPRPTGEPVIGSQTSGIFIGLDADYGGSCTAAAGQGASTTWGANTGDSLAECQLSTHLVTPIQGTITGSDDFGVGDKISIRLSDEADTKVNVGATTDFKFYSANTLSQLAGLQVDSITFNGDGTNDVIIAVSRIGAVTFDDAETTPNSHAYTGLVDITFTSSARNTALATMQSVVAATAVTIPLVETDYNTGRFEGNVRVRQHNITNNVVAATTLWDTDGGVNCATLANCIATLTTSDSQSMVAINGPITLKYTDALAASGSTDVARSATMNIDTTLPTAEITAPANKAEIQTRTPSFAGTLADTESGIDVSTFELHVDKTEDDTILTNYKDVIGSTGTVKATANKSNINVTTWVDGVTSKSWTYNYPDALPTNLTAGVTVNDTVDFQVLVRDMAGNVGYSDSDTATTNVDGVFAKFAPHWVKIDQVIPTLSASVTGFEYDTGNKIDKKNSKSLKVTFDGNVDADTVAAADFSVTLDTGGAKVPTTSVVNNADVYLLLEDTIPSNDTPKITIVGSISDKAGNVTDSGSVTATDGVPPVLTVATSGGSGLGAAGEATGPETLTNNKMTITITSDESLNGNPYVWVTEQGYDGGVNDDPNLNNYTAGEGGTAAAGGGGGSAIATAKGGNVYSIEVDNTNSSTTNTESRKMAIRVLATDLASNETTAGGDIATSTYTYVLDSKVGDIYASPTTTTKDMPYIQFAYADSVQTSLEDRETTALTITTATVDEGADGVGLVDIAADLQASADGITWFYKPAEALSVGKHLFSVKVKDAAGNEDTDTLTVTKSDRTDFKMRLYAGWNLISVPTDPSTPAVASVFSNTGVKQVIAYSATTPKQPWRIASQADGVWTSSTTPALENISAGAGYWVESSDFEDQVITLSGPTGAGDVRPALVTIPTAAGWNLIGVVDQDKDQSQKADFGTTLNVLTLGSATAQNWKLYVTGVSASKAYIYKAASSEFDLLDITNTTSPVTIGDGAWIYVSPQADGSLPDIVP
jgi:hypothetical protein